MNPFFCFSTPVYDPSTPNIQHRLTGWSHSGLQRILRFPGLHLFIDATFKVFPDPFKKILVIMARDFGNDMYIPVFHVFMSGKTAFLYKFAFKLCSAVTGGFDISTVCCDFEKALLNAIKSKTKT